MGTDADRLTEVREGFARSEFHRTFLGAQLERVTDDEVDAYVSNFIGTFKVGLATNAGMVGRLVDAEFYGLGPGYLDDFGGIVSAVTRDDVNAALRRHVHLDRLTTVIAARV